MIQPDQPIIFGNTVVVAISSVNDGDMKYTHPHVQQHRQSFLEKYDIHTSETSIIQVDYDTVDFLRYKSIVQSEGVLIADGVATQEVRTALFLPLADCTGAVLYDPKKHILMVSHLGRHSTEQYGGAASVQYMCDQYGCSASDILVWLSPSPNGIAYPLWKFDNRSFSQVIAEQLQTAGITPAHIEISSADTVHNPQYFSHSEFLKGNQPTDGRHAIVAMMR